MRRRSASNAQERSGRSCRLRRHSEEFDAFAASGTDVDSGFRSAIELFHIYLASVRMVLVNIRLDSFAFS